MTGNASQHSYRVEGMACDHCASAITNEIEALAGVTRVEVEVDTGVVTVTADGELDLDEVRSAVDEVGYELTAQLA